MRVICIVIMASLCLLAACSSTKLYHRNYIFNQDLLTLHKNYNESLNIQRSELIFGGGHVARNCLAYFKLVSQYDIDESIYNQSIKSEYLICDALKILSGISVYYDKSAKDFGEKLSSKLDLRSFPSSLFRMSQESKHTLKSLYPEDVKSTDSSAILETEDWIFRLEVVAVAQINDNDDLDWVVWLSDEAKSGNYRSYATFVLYDPENQEEYTATPYPWGL